MALIALYLGILSIAQCPSHALEQLSQDRFWVELIALGFAIQIGLYAYLRLIISAMQLAGATGLSGAVAFLAEWKIAFILFGLAVNALAIVMSIRMIRREREHLKLMEHSTETSFTTSSVAACH